MIDWYEQEEFKSEIIELNIEQMSEGSIELKIIWDVSWSEEQVRERVGWRCWRDDSSKW